MNKLAIDIVLLPPKEIMDLVISINRAAFERGKGRFKMSESDFVPHISLTIACINEEDLNQVIEKVNSIFKLQKPLQLKLTGIKLYERDDGKRGFITLDVSNELKNLHKSILTSIENKLQKCTDSKMLVDGETTGLSTTSNLIINNYKEKFAYSNYHPHITLCSFDSDLFAKDIKFPINFTANKLAIFQLGDGCTCRKLLFDYDLK